MVEEKSRFYLSVLITGALIVALIASAAIGILFFDLGGDESSYSEEEIALSLENDSITVTSVSLNDKTSLTVTEKTGKVIAELEDKGESTRIKTINGERLVVSSEDKSEKIVIQVLDNETIIKSDGESEGEVLDPKLESEAGNDPYTDRRG